MHLTPDVDLNIGHWTRTILYYMVRNHHIRQQRKSQLPEHSSLMPSKMARGAGNYKYSSPSIGLFLCPNQHLSFPSDCCRWRWTSVLEPNQASDKGIFYVSESPTVSEFNGKGQDSLKRQRQKQKKSEYFYATFKNCSYISLTAHTL